MIQYETINTQKTLHVKHKENTAHQHIENIAYQHKENIAHQHIENTFTTYNPQIQSEQI